VKASQIIKNVAMNWVALAVSVLVSFFLAPFIVHHLGNVVYGAWVLVNSIVGYLKLLDLGMRGAVVRYVSKAHAQNDHQEAGEIVSAAVWFRLRLTALLMVASAAFAFVFPRVFKLPLELGRDAQVALIFAACTTALTLVLGIAGSVLASFPRYDLISGVEVGQTVLRVAGIVVLLKRGHGIVALAGWELLCTVVADALLLWLVRRVYPQLRLYWSKPCRETMRRIWGYSLWIFVLQTAVQVVYLSDNIVVGAYLSAAMVALYAIGGTLARYCDQVVAALSTTITPIASRFEATGDMRRVRMVVVRGTQGTLLVALPILITLLLRGPSFIGLWMGPSYARSSGVVLQILVIARFLSIANLASGGVAFGMERHKPVALMALAEGAVNLALSIVLVQHIGVLGGIVGVAWGTTIPSVLVQLFFWPRHIASITGMRIRDYILPGWLKPAAAALPFALATWAVEQYWPATRMLLFWLQTAGLCLIYAGCAWAAFHDLLKLTWRKPVSEAAVV
jgi:O-antigen/teichoic acid export membrane protein